MKKIISVLILILGAIVLSGCKNNEQMTTIANPWEDYASTSLAAKKAGFQFPLEIDNSSVRAMEGMMEITHKTDDNREFIIRKSDSAVKIEGYDDISGVYTKYPQNKEYTLSNGVKIRIRGEGDKIYVMNMSAEDGYFSCYCPQGMTKDELDIIYSMLAQAHERIQYSK